MKGLNFVVSNEFVRLTYTEAIEILTAADRKWEYPWDGEGIFRLNMKDTWWKSISSGRSSLLIIPKEIKAFYMKQNDDGKTVKAMDVLFPGIGEIIGGSQREENYDVLMNRIKELKLPEKDLWWYLETRKFGTAPHSGFGLGFERLILFMTGMSNIRDVIPFPRTPKNAEF